MIFRIQVLNALPLSQVNHHVRPDSMVTYQAAKLVVEEEGFDELLGETMDRVDQIEGMWCRLFLSILQIGFLVATSSLIYFAP